MQVFRNSPIPPHVPIMDCIKLALLADDLRRGDTLPSIPRHCDVVQGNWLESQHRVAGLLEIEADRYLQALIQDEQMRRTSLRSLCFASNLRGGRSGTAYDPPQNLQRARPTRSSPYRLILRRTPTWRNACIVLLVRMDCLYARAWWES